jgi:hypothetical protein
MAVTRKILGLISLFSVLTVSFSAIPPANDDFASPLILTLDEPLTNEFGIATRELNESWTTSPETIWYQWTAPASRSYAYIASPLGILNFPPQTLGVFTGDDVANFTTVACIEGCFGAIPFQAIAGQIYRIGVGIAASPDTYVLRATITAGPPNDDFASATELFGMFVLWTSTTMGATSEQGEETLGTSLPSASVWARWTAPQSGQFRFSDPGVQVYTGGSLTSLQSVRLPGFDSAFIAETGKTYYFRFASGPEYMTPFNLRLGPELPNENIAAAQELIGTNVSFQTQNWASRGTLIGTSIVSPWFKWTAPANGSLTYSISDNSPTGAVVLAFHDKRPTIFSNILHLSYAHSMPDSAARSNTTIVTEGVTYYFGLKAPPSTNLGMNLHFQDASISVPAGALIGGKQFSFLQTNTVFSPPSAVQLGPVALPDATAWIEYTFPEPGIVYFKTKLRGTNFPSFFIASDQPYIGTTFFSSPHDWTDRVLYLNSGKLTVRFVLVSSSPATAWIDDLHFIPFNPRPAEIRASLKLNQTVELSLPLERYYRQDLESSTNLVDWVRRSVLRTTSPANVLVPLSLQIRPANSSACAQSGDLIPPSHDRIVRRHAGALVSGCPASRSTRNNLQPPPESYLNS